jgi:sulfur-oxidizing protein SoxX
MKHRILLIATAAAVVAGCASLPSSQQRDLDRQAQEVIKSSFRDRGIATIARLDQDLGQQACSSEHAPSEQVAREIQAAALASIRWPADGSYLGDWREGEKLAQNGRGSTWTDSATADNGGNCYNCHQLSKSELSYGTIGPSLYQYGKLRGVADPGSPASAEIVKYTWGKLWNSKAYAACSNMPRFGHAGLLKEQQLRHIMALLLDPKSPVNQ